jgi:glycosyltransferase involved in cell wall biosynthesis
MEEYLVKENIGLVAFGSQDPFKQLKIDKDIETRFLGFIKTDEEMAKVLSSADVMLVPSLAENYPFVVLEPLSCKTPVVAFSIGGIPEMIDHGGNGYLAKVGDKEDFIKGIEFCLEGKMDKSKRDYPIETKAKEYLKLFNNSREASLS